MKPTHLNVKKLTAALFALGCSMQFAVAADLSKEQMQQEIELLKAQLQQQQQQINALVQAQQKTATPVTTNATVASTAPAVTANNVTTPTTEKDTSQASNTSIGGYGEMVYNHYSKDSSKDQADLSRAVLFVGHQFNDRLKFNSEIEWEHAVASSSDKGETEIEQAYLDYQLKQALNLKAGLFLMPFGFINTSHEPPTYYGALRNEIETRIIPSTWREGGVGLYGNNYGVDWDLGITTGFDITKLDDTGKPLAASHQEMQFAHAHDPAFYSALNYRGILGLTVGGAVFTGNAAQGNANFKTDATQPNFAAIKGRVTLGETHVRWQGNGLDLQALYAKGHIGDAAKIDNTLQAYNATNNATRAYVPEEFYGWLVQGAYTVWDHQDMSLTPFVRFEKFNTQSKMPDGFSSDKANADRVGTVGVSFKPVSEVVVKMDYQKYWDNPNNNRFNIGLGYMF